MNNIVSAQVNEIMR